MKQKFEGVIQMPEFPGRNASGFFCLFVSVFLDASEAVFIVTSYPVGQCML